MHAEKKNHKKINFLARFTSIGGNVIVLTAATWIFTADELGYYYVFLNLLFIYFMLELGISKIITQKIAYYLEINSKQEYLNFKHSIRWWYRKVMHLSLPVGLFVGLIYFHREDYNIQLTWIAYSLSLPLIMKYIFINSYLEGLGNPRQAAKIRLIQGATYALIGTLLLLTIRQLWVLPIALILSYSISIYKTGKSIYNIRRGKWSAKFWRTNIRKIQTNIALQWLLGGAAIYSLVPMCMKFMGSIEAAKIGLALQVMNTVSSFININLQADTAKRIKYTKSIKLIKMSFYVKESLVSIITWLTIVCSTLIILGIIADSGPIKYRLPSSEHLTYLISGGMMQLLIIKAGYYLRDYECDDTWRLYLIINILSLAYILMRHNGWLQNVDIYEMYFCSMIFSSSIYTIIKFRYFAKQKD